MSNDRDEFDTEDDVQGHRVHVKGVTTDTEDDVEGHRVHVKGVTTDDEDDDVQGHGRLPHL